MKKLCFRCKRQLLVKNFNWKYKNKRRCSYCKECSRELIKIHYYNNHKYYLDKAKKRNKELKRKAYNVIGNYLLKHPCVDCGEKDIKVLEFDHKDPNIKKYNITNLIVKTGGSFNKLKEEIKKCDVRCANCHKRKTVNETKGWRLNFAPVA